MLIFKSKQTNEFDIRRMLDFILKFKLLRLASTIISHSRSSKRVNQKVFIQLGYREVFTGNYRDKTVPEPDILL